MKTFLWCLFIALTGHCRIIGQTPTPAAVSDDVSKSASPAATPGAVCPVCGSGEHEDDKNGQSAKASDADTASLTQLEQDWGNALMHNDKPALERIVADEYMSVSPDGAVAFKAEHLATAAEIVGKMDSFRFSNVQVRVYGETAVVTGDGMIHWTTNEIDGVPLTTVPFRWMDVFVKRDGRWQAVASQATNVTRAASRLGRFSPPMN